MCSFSWQLSSSTLALPTVTAQQGGMCMPGAAGGFTCQCNMGFSGADCKTKDNCRVTSDAAISPCGAHGTCANDATSSTGFTCTCQAGYSGALCQVCNYNGYWCAEKFRRLYTRKDTPPDGDLTHQFPRVICTASAVKLRRRPDLRHLHPVRDDAAPCHQQRRGQH